MRIAELFPFWDALFGTLLASEAIAGQPIAAAAPPAVQTALGA
jgi:sterol desaturase/sphingolipid hydroxylase (fatty acid hydroxylase superfamily)